MSTVAIGLALASTLVAGQDVPRTPWGEPDLQGVWSYATLTPLERPVDVGSVFTPEEAAALTTRRKSDRPDRPGVDPGGYNALWYDNGWVLPDQRTSQIVDPPDGRPAAVERRGAGPGRRAQ